MKMYPAVILAGGLATRLGSLTIRLPKSLVEINGEPFVKHQLRLLKSQGITEIIFCLGYLGDMVEKYIQGGDDLGLDIVYSYDGEKQLGTGGAIKKALPLLPDNFFVIYGDSYLLCDYVAIQQAFKLSEKKGLMTVYRNDGQWDKSNVEFLNNEILVYDKEKMSSNMNYIDYGLGVFKKDAFSLIPEDQVYDLAKLYQSLLFDNQLGSYEVKQRFYEIGSRLGIEEFSQYLTQSRSNI